MKPQHFSFHACPLFFAHAANHGGRNIKATANPTPAIPICRSLTALVAASSNLGMDSTYILRSNVHCVVKFPVGQVSMHFSAFGVILFQETTVSPQIAINTPDAAADIDAYRRYFEAVSREMRQHIFNFGWNRKGGES